MSQETVLGERDPSERRIEVATRAVFLGCAALTVLVTVGIVASLLKDALVFFADPAVEVRSFILGTDWKPTQLTGDGEYAFGMLPLLSGTIVVTIAAAAVALPTGVAAALYLSEYASDRVRSVLKPALEVLAGVPTVVYGYFALVYVTPVLDRVLPVGTFNALSAAIVMGVMIVPMVSSISEDALSAVPDELRAASYGLGASKFDTSVRVVVPAAASGIFSSFVLALSRAIGETMIVTIAAGQTPRMLSVLEIEENLLQSSQTLTSAMVHLAQAENVGGDNPAVYALFALGLVLFAFTFAMNLVAEWMRGHYREVYE